MSWADQPGPGDEVVKDKDLTVLVDRKASLFLIGTTMDYEVKDADRPGLRSSTPTKRAVAAAARVSTCEVRRLRNVVGCGR